MLIKYGSTTHILLILCLIIFLGYLLGSIKIKKFSLGTAAIFIVALLFGIAGSRFQDSLISFDMPSILSSLGVIFFVSSIGLNTGNNSFESKKHILYYALIGMICVIVGVMTCVMIIKYFHLDSSLAVGLLSGSLTSTPGYSAAQEVVNGSETQLYNIAVGHGVAYPFGVLAVVSFVQLVPIFEKEKSLLNVKKLVGLDNKDDFDNSKNVRKKSIKQGLVLIAITAVIGTLLGTIKIPLIGGGMFSLGNTGGILFIGIIIGKLRNIQLIKLDCEKEFLNGTREIGLMLFLASTGYEGGKSFLEVFGEYGVSLFVYGVLMTVFPMICAFLFSKYLLKMQVYDNLGAITGGMTSTPALGALIDVKKSDVVTNAYAMTYPFALMLMVLGCRWIMVYF